MSTMLSMFTLYQDPDRARTWLVEAFGFEVVNEWSDDRDELVHCELRLDDAVVIVQRAADGQGAAPLVKSSSVRAPVLCLGDDQAVETLFDRVTAAGATVVRAPGTTEWGNRRFEVLDPEGHQWSVGSYVPGVPAAW